MKLSNALFITSLALFQFLPAQANESVNAAANVNAIQLTKKISTVPTVVRLTNSTRHLIDFSNTNLEVIGLWVDNPQEFSKSFKIKDLGPNVFEVESVVGGSSKFTVNVLVRDLDGKKRTLPLRLIKQLSSKNITQFYNLIPQASEESVASRDRSTVTEAKNSAATSVAVLEQGALVAMQRGILDPELRSRVQQLVSAAKAGQSIEQAASNIGLSRSAVDKLMSLGTNPNQNPKAAQ